MLGMGGSTAGSMLGRVGCRKRPQCEMLATTHAETERAKRRVCDIRARISRLWEHRRKSDNSLVGLHMVLADEEGQGIPVFVPQCLEYKFSMQIEEGRVYYFRNFNTRPIKAGRKWRCAYRSYELRFTTETDVRPIVPEPDDFPLYAYRLRSFKDLLHTVTDNTYLADVVGLVTGISDIMTFKVKQKRTVRLYDGSDHAIIHLWDEFADELDADELIRRSKSEPVILLAMGFMFGKEYSMLSLKTAYGCRICINPASSDILAFRNRIIGIDHSIERIDDRGDRLCASVVGNTSVTNLVSEGCSPGAVNTGSCDLVAEHTVSAAQEHNAELSSSALALAPGERETPKQRACYFGTPQAASASSNEKKGESDGRTEVVTVFLDTNLGSGLTVPVITSASTVADLKRRVSDEHAAAFPSFGKMLGNAVRKMLNSQVARLFGYRWFWCREEFKPEYKLAHPYTDNERRITAEAAKWRSMTGDEKAPYFSKAQERKVEYSGSSDAAAPAVAR